MDNVSLNKISKNLYSIYPRKCKNGNPIYYVRFKKHDGSYTTAKSTGKSIKEEAIKYINDCLNNDLYNLSDNYLEKDFEELYCIYNKYKHNIINNKNEKEDIFINCLIEAYEIGLKNSFNIKQISENLI